MSQNIKEYKKGDLIIQEGQVATAIHFIQSGRVSLFHEKNGKLIEIQQISNNHIIGEQSLFGGKTHGLSAKALSPVKIMEVPLKVIMDQYESSQGGVKLVLRSLVDDTKKLRKEIQSQKMEQEDIPCPQPNVGRVFCILGMVTRLEGEQKEDHWEIKWDRLKLFTNKLFLEMHGRVQSALELLTKLEWAEMIYEPSEEDEEQEVLTTIKIKDLDLVQKFAEFYQYYYFKPGRSEIIHVDSLAMQVTRLLLKVTEDSEVDRQGAVRVEYNHLIDELKSKFRFDFKTTHIDNLEKKGLLVKRQSTDDGPVYFIFDRSEFEETYKYWRIILEIDKWNEKGYVDMDEVDAQLGGGEAADGFHQCPNCSIEINEEANFCAQCGFNLKAAA